MKTNELKRGFTLVELLSVIGILVVLISIGVLSYIKIHNNVLETTLENKKTIAKTAALKYGEENKDEIWASDGGCVTKTNYELIEQGYLTSDSKDSISYVNPVDGKELNDTYNICYLNGEIVLSTGNYKLTINPNGGFFNDKTTTTILYMESLEINNYVKNPIRDGHVFLGWNIIREGSSPNTINMIAEWEEAEDKEYIVKYDCNGGTGDMLSEIHVKDREKSLAKNECINIKEGESGMVYKLIGWSTSNTSTTPQFTDEQLVKNINNGDEVTLYAVWKNMFHYSGAYEVINDYNYRGVDGDWEISFKSSGSFSFYYKAILDVFLVGGGGACDLTSVGKCYYASGGAIVIDSIDVNNYNDYFTIGLGGQSRIAKGEATTGFGLTASGGYSDWGYNAGYSAGVVAFNDSHNSSQLYSGTMSTTGNAPNNSGKGSFNGCGGTSYKGGSGIIVIRNHR